MIPALPALLILGVGAPVPREAVQPIPHSGVTAVARLRGASEPRKGVRAVVPLRSVPKPRPVVTHGSGRTGPASWFCVPGRSACTVGHPASCLCAAAGPALRAGNWRGRVVTVSSGGRSVRVRLIDWCACPGGRLIDLYGSAFSRLGGLSRGVINVTVTW